MRISTWFSAPAANSAATAARVRANHAASVAGRPSASAGASRSAPTAVSTGSEPDSTGPDDQNCPFRIASRAPLMATGTTGACAFSAMMKPPFLNGNRAPVRLRVPSGKIRNELPSRSAVARPARSPAGSARGCRARAARSRPDRTRARESAACAAPPCRRSAAAETARSAPRRGSAARRCWCG